MRSVIIKPAAAAILDGVWPRLYLDRLSCTDAKSNKRAHRVVMSELSYNSKSRVPGKNATFSDKTKHRYGIVIM